MKLNMTVPVVVNAGPECRPKWSWCKRNVTVAFFVPLDYQVGLILLNSQNLYFVFDANS